MFQMTNSANKSVGLFSLKQIHIASPVMMISEHHPMLFAKKNRLSPFDERRLLQGPIIDTPESLKASFLKMYVPTPSAYDPVATDSVASPQQARDGSLMREPLSICRDSVVADEPHQQQIEPPEATGGVGWVDLMLCHQDFPHLVALSSQVASTDPTYKIPPEIEVALERLKWRLSGKNLTIHRGLYPWVDLKIDVYIDLMRQALKSDDTRSTIGPSSKSVPGFGNWRKVEKQKYNQVMASTFKAGNETKLDTRSIIQTSDETRVPVADVVACLKSRRRKSIKPSALRRSADDILFATGRLNTPGRRHSSAVRRSPRLAGLDDQNVMSTNLRVSSTSSGQVSSAPALLQEPEKKRGRPLKSAATAAPRRGRGRPPKKPKACELNVESTTPPSSSSELRRKSGTPNNPSSVRSSGVSRKRSPRRGPRLFGVVTSPLNGSNEPMSDSVMATDGNIALTPRRVKISSRRIDIRTVEIPKENNMAPMSNVTFRGEDTPLVHSFKTIGPKTSRSRSKFAPRDAMSSSSSLWKCSASTATNGKEEMSDQLGASWRSAMLGTRSARDDSSSGNDNAWWPTMRSQDSSDSDDGSVTKNQFAA
jgi:hypothetical protein